MKEARDVIVTVAGSGFKSGLEFFVTWNKKEKRRRNDANLYTKYYSIKFIVLYTSGNPTGLTIHLANESPRISKCNFRHC